MSRALLLVVLTAAAPSAAYAHPLAPAGFTLTIEGRGASLVSRVPRRVRIGERPSLRWPADCHEAPAPERLVGAWVERRTRLDCAASLAGREVALTGVRAGGTTALLRVTHEGNTWERMLDASAPRAQLLGNGNGNENGNGNGLALGWAKLGALHFATGLDHVLLLVGLVLTLGFRRRLLLALGAFTAGHALTLVLAAGLRLTPPAAIVEPAILATLVLVGLELPEGSRSLVARRPVLVPLAVGLVHGGGFAGGLTGLTGGAGALAAALVPFHFGLELAQLGVVALLAGAARLGAGRVRPSDAHRVAAGRLLGAVAFALLMGLLAGSPAP
ncbi:MAG: HupE/UreJ family protein [Myxococcota bacterium]